MKSDGGASIDASSSDGGPLAAADAGIDAPAGPPKRVQIDEDGNDDEEDVGTGKAPAPGGTAKFEKVGTPPLALTRICDLTPLGDALYLAHAHQPLGIDGATITRYRPHDEKKPFTIAFDWNRFGEPTKGGGAGQGFVRIRNIGGRLFVPDADPPYGGLGQVDWGTEGYMFISDTSGTFAPPRPPHFRPPQLPDIGANKPGAGVIPRAYHVLDVIKFRGHYFTSTGSVPPKQPAWNGPSPGALHRSNADGTRWIYEVDYPYPWQNGVWRLTYMVRFRDRLYAGIQDYDGRDPNDFVYFTPSEPKAEDAPDGGTPPVLKREDIHPVRVTKTGASGTLRWWVDKKVNPPRLYWLAWTREGILIRVTTDGDNWAVIPLPDDAGRPTDVTRFRDAVVVLTERGLYRLDGAAIDAPKELLTTEGVADASAKLIGIVELDAKKKSPFEVGDFFCTAPIAVHENVLYAGGQRGGTLYKLAE
jgi:hypothetical protein